MSPENIAVPFDEVLLAEGEQSLLVLCSPHHAEFALVLLVFLFFFYWTELALLISINDKSNQFRYNGDWTAI